MKKKEKFREYKIVKIARDNHFYWKPMYKDDETRKKEWRGLGILIKGTDIIMEGEYKYKFGAMKRIVQDIQMLKFDKKFEVFDEIPCGKINLNDIKKKDFNTII